MDERPLKTSVVLTLLNEGEGLRVLLDALMQQTLPPDEIVIVDGGSTDGTVEILDEYAAKDVRVHVMQEAGVNIARGRNIAIAAAHHPIIAVTDGGCRPDSAWLEKLVEPLQHGDAYAAVAGKVEADPQTRFEYYAALLGMLQDSGDSSTRSFLGRSSAFRKSAWELAGGYPEWLYTAEDTLFAKRFNQLGMKVAIAEDSKLYWRPRRTLYRLAKMFFLYGVGNGRIDSGSVSASRYWLRYHVLWMVSLIFGLFFPWLLLVTVAAVGQLFRIAVIPALKEVSKATQAWDRFWYVSLIVFVRSFATNAGFLVGSRDLRSKPLYRRSLETYRRSETPSKSV